MNISFFAAAVVSGTPLLFAIVGEILTQKSGNLNLGVEGMMLMGGVAGFLGGMMTKNPFIAILCAALSGGIGAFIYGFLTVTLKANQNVCGLTLTIFGAGFSSFMGKGLVGTVVPANIKAFFKPVAFPILSRIPFIGDIFFKQDIFIYGGYVIAIIAGIYLYRTRMGLNLRAVGENAAAADASGIHVSLYKYIHIIAGGMLCGLGGAYLSLVYVPVWQENVTAGRGWIAVALVIFASWNPVKAIGAAFLFGGLDIIGFRLQGGNMIIPQYFIDMVPYIATILVLILKSNKNKKENRPPMNLGEPYFREER